MISERNEQAVKLCKTFLILQDCKYSRLYRQKRAKGIDGYGIKFFQVRSNLRIELLNKVLEPLKLKAILTYGSLNHVTNQCSTSLVVRVIHPKKKV